MNPPVHGNPNKMARVSFRINGEYKSFTLKASDREAALSHVKASYPGAKSISVVFFVKAEGEL